MRIAACAKVALLALLLSLGAHAVFGRENGEASSRGDMALRAFSGGVSVQTVEPAANPSAEPAAPPGAKPNAPAAGWNRMFIAPGFGTVLYKVRVEQDGIPEVTSSFGEDEYLAAALETRVFWGVNITRRAGFYTGVEVGGTVFLPQSATYTDPSVVINDSDGAYTTSSLAVTFKTSVYGGTVFLLWKYGYRYEFDFEKSGLSFGLQLGTGLSVFSGGYDVWIGDKDNPDAEAGWSTQSARLSLATDFSFETAFRFGKNFRLFAAAGLLVTPLSFEEQDQSYLSGSEVMQDGVANADADYIPFALNSYRVEVEGFGFSLRAGASVNF